MQMFPAKRHVDVQEGTTNTTTYFLRVIFLVLFVLVEVLMLEMSYL